MANLPRLTSHKAKTSRWQHILTFSFILIVILLYITNYKHTSQSNAMSNPVHKQSIPRSIIFGNPDKTNVKLSYNGKYITYVAPFNGVLNIYLASNHNIANTKPLTKDTHRGITSYAWSYDNQHILYQQDTNGDENTIIYSIDINTGELFQVTHFKDAKNGILGLSKHYPNYALVLSNERRKDLFDVYLLNIKDNILYLIYQNDKYASIETDDNFQLRFGSIMNPDASITIDKFEKQDNGIPALIQALENNLTINETQKIIQQTQTSEFIIVPTEDSKTTDIVGFSQDESKIYMVDSRDRNTSALIEIDVNSKEKKVLFSNNKADIESFIQNPITKLPEAVSYNYTKSELHYLDESFAHIYNNLKNKIKGEIVIVSRSLDDKIWILGEKSDIKTVQYYKVHISHDNSLKIEFLFSSDIKFDNYQLASMHPVVIKTRDGLDLVSYLTVPKHIKITTHNNDIKTVETAETVPLIMYVHGGPTARDDWGFNKVHQWLVDRGYAVLSVNYRGSTGFGKDFINAGNGEWSRKMHTDILDAANWAVSHGITSKDKIGIMGGSYGGYEALVGLTFTPEFFQCAIDIVGPSSLKTILETIPEYWKPGVVDLENKLGGNLHSQEGIKELYDRSPITYVDNIIKPLLIGHGLHDPRVKEAESKQIVDIMRTKHIPVIYALYTDEGHGFARPENRVSFFAFTEYFLHQYLGGSFEPLHGNELNNISLVRTDLELEPLISAMQAVIE